MYNILQYSSFSFTGENKAFAIMGMRDNWDRFLQITKSKSKSHSKAAQYWDSVHSFVSLSIIILGATTTFLSLISSVPSFVISAIAALTTLISAISAFMRPHDRRQVQTDSAKEFKVLMMRMVRCETEAEYEELWRELNNAMMDEPFLPKKFISDDIEVDWSITPELQVVIAEKEHEMEEALDDYGTAPILPDKNDMGIPSYDDNGNKDNMEIPSYDDSKGMGMSSNGSNHSHRELIELQQQQH